jgi:hypothetical protein
LGAWIGTAQAAANNTSNYLLLTQPSSSTVIGFYVAGTGTLSINWGDGSTNTYALNGSPQAISHTFGSAGTYGVTLIGNVTYFESSSEAGIGGSTATYFGGNIATMTGLGYLYVIGTNTLSGSITNLTGLTCLCVEGSNTLSGSVTNLTGLTTLWAGSQSTLSGSVSALTQLRHLCICSSSNSITGSVTNLTNLLDINDDSSGGTLSGKIDNLTSLEYFRDTGGSTFDYSTTNWNSFPSLSYVQVKNLTQSQVDGLLGGMWYNKDASKPVNGFETGTIRTIICTSGCSAPSSTGYTYKAALQGYKTPNNTGPMVWTVNTN